MGVADAIVNDGLLLDAFLGNWERKMNRRFVVARGVNPNSPRILLTLWTADLNAVGYSWRSEHANFERI